MKVIVGIGDMLITQWKMLSLDFAVEDSYEYCQGELMR